MNAINVKPNKVYKILITGACGFIGRSFIENLENSPHLIYALDLQSCLFFKNAVKTFYSLDLARPFQLDETFDFVFHLGGYNVTHVGSQDNALYTKVNVQGTKHLLQSAKIKNFIFLSTTKVYKPDGNIDEQSTVEPKNGYEQSKWEAEQICAQYFQGGNLTILRSVNIIGPGQMNKAIVPIFFDKALTGKLLNIFVPRDTRLQFVSVTDVIDLFHLIIARGGLHGTFNVAFDECICIDELAKKIIELCHSQSQIHCMNDDRTNVSQVSALKIQQAIGWKPTSSIEETLKECYEFYK